jgi:hypothetical protein
MDEEQQKSDDAFKEGFAQVTGNGNPAQEKPVAEEPKTEQVEADSEQEIQEAAEEAGFAGFTASEIKALLSRAAKVDQLEDGLRKAHGKLGELNGVIQEFRKAPSQAQAKEEPTEFAHVEEDYPDIAAYIRAQTGAIEKRIPEAMPQQQPAATNAVDMQAELMDHLHDGWREKIGSQDFGLWIATQPDDVRETFNSTQKAKELSAVIGKFDAWANGRETRQTKSKQRLEQALTPTGNPGKPKLAPNEHDAFLAGFRSAMG